MDLIKRLIFQNQAKFGTVLNDAIRAEDEAKKPSKLEKLKNGENLYREHNHVHLWLRDCPQDTPESVEGSVTGVIPSWLSGTLIRNGPGKRTWGKEKTVHAFDGSALLRKFVIKNGKVTFQAKFLDCDTYKRNTEAQRVVLSEFGTLGTPDPCKSVFQRFSSEFLSFENDATDNCVISVWPFNDEVYAMTETLLMHRISPHSLQSLRKVDMRHHVSLVHHTAHHHMDPDGTVYSLGMTAVKGGVEYAIIGFPKSKTGTPKGEDVLAEAKIVATVPTRWRFSPSYMHAYGLSPNYFVVIEQPLVISAITMKLMKILKASFLDTLKWYDEPTLIHVVSRATGKVARTFEAEPFFFFHTINQFEADGQVVIDLCCYKDFTFTRKLMDHHLNNMQKDPNFADYFRGRPVRFVCPVDPAKKDGNLVKLEGSKAKAEWRGSKIQVTGEILLDKSCEMPRVNYDFNGKPYRYFYCFAGDLDDNTPIALQKVDIETRTALSWGEEGAYPSEPVFVPRPQSTEEDDGVLLSSLLYADDDEKVSLLVLDAKNMKELGRADVKAAGAIPAGFHGWFFDEQFVKNHTE